MGRRPTILDPLFNESVTMLFTQPTYLNPPRSILIADDDEMILDLLTLRFEKCGIKVFKAENGLDAWDLFNSEAIDFVLTDIQMPGLSGKELSQRIRHQSPRTKIAVMTGGDADVASALVAEGTANFFFTKPFDFDRLFKSIMG